MTLPINLTSYLFLIKEDIKWLLKNTNNDTEREHIIGIIKESVKYFYPNQNIDDEFIDWWESTINISEEDADKPRKLFNSCGNCNKYFECNDEHADALNESYICDNWEDDFGWTR